ncbi:hypothetical protein [Rubritalea tangerina]
MVRQWRAALQVFLMGGTTTALGHRMYNNAIEIPSIGWILKHSAILLSM